MSSNCIYFRGHVNADRRTVCTALHPPAPGAGSLGSGADSQTTGAELEKSYVAGTSIQQGERRKDIVELFNFHHPKGQVK